ncbi:MAG: hypothetical protein KF684_06245 [Phycisphaeraceae bacterium]|nr:hypothetical protein [Phycisphaeraceae bacterium]
MDRSTKLLGIVASSLLTTPGVAIATAPLAAFALLGASASAQLSEVEPYYVVVTEDNVNLRCGAGQVWYAVGKVNRGQVLRVDGHEFGWLRVGYPQGIAAIVRSRDAEFDEKSGVVVLVRESRLQANNPAGGVGESWRPLLDYPMPADSVLQHIETIRSSSGEVTGYRVVAPGGAKGFISDSLVRPATESEVQTLLAQSSAPVAPTTTPARPTQSPTPAPAPVETPAPIETQPEFEPDDDPIYADEPEPMPEPAPTPTRQDPAPVVREAAPTQSGDDATRRFPPPAADEPARAPTPTPSQPIRAGGSGEPARTAPMAPPRFEDLQRTLEEVMRQPTEGAEYEPLINEFKRFADSLPDTPESENARRAAMSRIELLRLRADLQRTLQSLAETEAIADSGTAQVEQSVRTVNEAPAYAFVGRLTTSTVYTGQRLPRLFRLQAVDSGRTLAYITPDPALDLEAKLGSVVGVVVRQSRQDATLGLPLIDARRIDQMTADQIRSR